MNKNTLKQKTALSFFRGDKIQVEIKQTVKDFLIRWQFQRLARRLRSNYGSPFIIIGMHRSGTSLVSRLLREAGGYLGSVLEPNGEAPVFLRLNDCILRCAKTTWCVVPHDFNSTSLLLDSKAIKWVLANEDLLWLEFFRNFGDTGVEYEHQKGDTPVNKKSIIRLLSRKKWPYPERGVPFWGWKDPRNTLTLPLWLKLFPNACVIHVVRNGIDAALSLWRRCQKLGVGAPYCLDLNYCFNLWERYVEEGLRWCNLLEERCHKIHYEHLLDDQLLQIRNLLTFVGTPIGYAESLVKQINGPNRGAQHWLDHPELLQCALRSNVFRQLGYAQSAPTLNK